MIVKGLIDEDFVNYKKPSMLIAFPSCTWKCEKECGEHCCQNNALAQAPDIDTNRFDIVNRYIANPITSAIVFSGLEPFDSWRDIQLLIDTFRQKTNDPIIIYSGYTEDELKYEAYEDHIENKIKWLCQYPNIIVKFGRYIPNHNPHFDAVLGVELSSDNQYAKVVS